MPAGNPAFPGSVSLSPFAELGDLQSKMNISDHRIRHEDADRSVLQAVQGGYPGGGHSLKQEAPGKPVPKLMLIVRATAHFPSSMSDNQLPEFNLLVAGCRGGVSHMFHIRRPPYRLLTNLYPSRRCPRIRQNIVPPSPSRYEPCLFKDFQGPARVGSKVCPGLQWPCDIYSVRVH